ncbi:c-type cytochrome, partial [Phenylobacterium sp.]|uniref:c-type cytochrome n=1 Tax=Phenylobacterium sp. TaxID=1871053 RepID=UPI002E367805
RSEEGVRRGLEPRSAKSQIKPAITLIGEASPRLYSARSDGPCDAPSADGRSLWIMPSDAFSRLSDAETADLITYLRTFPARGAPQPAKVLGPVGRVGVLIGKFRSAPAILKASRDAGPPDLGPQFAQGRTLARACMECHGLDLKGSTTVNAPDLAIAGAYDPADFERLLRTGVAAGGRKLGLMSEVAPGRFNAFSHEEIAALHAYLKARAS